MSRPEYGYRIGTVLRREGKVDEEWSGKRDLALRKSGRRAGGASGGYLSLPPEASRRIKSKANRSALAHHRYIPWLTGVGTNGDETDVRRMVFIRSLKKRRTLRVRETVSRKVGGPRRL